MSVLPPFGGNLLIQGVAIIMNSITMTFGIIRVIFLELTDLTP